MVAGADLLSISRVAGVHAPFGEIVVRSALVYLAIVAGMRLTGARQLGQMTPFDLVLILLIANAVQNAMVGSDVTIFGGVAAAGTLLVLNRITGALTDRLPFFRRTLEGEPVLLLRDGDWLEQALRRTGVSRDLVRQAIREHGFEDETRVHAAVLEVDGTVSIVPTSDQVIRTRHRVRAVRPGGN